MKTTFAFLSLTGLATAQLNLNTAGPDWDYLASDLANTTSAACKAAYSANIDCTETLVGLVASMRPSFQPDASDLDATCTSSCTAALASYVANVEAACTAPGDKAQESVGGGDYTDMYLDPVATVGEIFQYTLQSDCAKDSNGSYCYFQTLADASTFSCDDECAMQFYQTAHDSPVSDKEFNYYWLISRGSWWAAEFQIGWERLVQCGKAVGAGNSSIASASASGSASATGAGHTIQLTATAADTAAATTAGSFASMATGTSTAGSFASTATGTSTVKGSFSATATPNSGRSLGGGEGAAMALLTFIFVALFV